MTTTPAPTPDSGGQLATTTGTAVILADHCKNNFFDRGHYRVSFRRPFGLCTDHWSKTLRLCQAEITTQNKGLQLRVLGEIRVA